MIVENNLSESVNEKEIEMQVLTTPRYVPNENESDDKIINRQNKFIAFSPQVRFKLSSSLTSQKIQSIGQKYQFELLRLANITRLIREYYFGEVRFEDFTAEIEKRMGVSLLTAQEIARYIKQEIIDWDPWGEYLSKLPHLPLRQILTEYPHIANTEITAGYVELNSSDELEDPTIKNWLQDYISHLGYEKHSHMEQTEYLFHSENTKNLSSQDREKLGIILKSFDENIPLPVDEENGEIVFDGIENQVGDGYIRPAPAANTKVAYTRPLRDEQPAPIKQESFIRPYNPAQAPQRQVSKPIPEPIRTLPLRQTSAPTQNSLKLAPIPPAAPPEEKFHPNLVSLPNRKTNPNIDKFFNAPESRLPETLREPARNASSNVAGGQANLRNDAGGDIPGIKVHSITERNVPPVRPQAPPQSIASRPVAPSQPPLPLRPNLTRREQESAPRPKYRIIDPFSAPMAEPRIQGNIVDLSGEE